MQVETVTPEIPLAPVPAGGHVPRHVEVNSLTARQGQSLQVLRAGLYERSLRLASGKYIESNADALRWLLEQLPACRAT